MIRTRTKKTLTPAEQARQVKMLTAMGERLTRDNVIMFIAGVTPKVQVHNRRVGPVRCCRGGRGFERRSDAVTN